MRSLPTRKRNSSFDFQISKVFLKERYEKKTDLSLKLKILFKKILSFIRWLTPVAIVCTVFYTLYFFAYRSNFFTIKEVLITGAYSYVNFDDVHSIASNKLVGQNILTQENKDIETLLKKNFLGIKDIDVEKKYPDKVTISLVERVPIAQIQVKADSDKYLIDEDGYVLGISDDSANALPLINYEGEIRVGNFIDFNIVPLALDIINYSKTEQLELSSMSFKGKDTTFFTNGSIEALLDFNVSVKKSMNIVSELIKKSQTEGKSIKKIDLRYDKVIVLYD